MPDILSLPLQVAFDGSGRLMPGAKVWLTLTGTNTPSPAYTTDALTTPLANPLIANGFGRIPTAYLDSNIQYRVRLYSSTQTVGVDTPVQDSDPYSGGFIQAGTGAVDRSVEAKLREIVTVEDYGAVGNGTTDDTAAIQAAIDANYGGAIRFLGKKYRTTGSLTINNPIEISGVYPSGKIDDDDDYGGGTSLYFDHTGVGIEVEAVVGTPTFNGVAIRNLGTRRNQPALGGGWAPTDHSYDISVSGVGDVDIENILMLNATRGIGLIGDLGDPPPTGRVNIFNLRGQFFKKAIYIQMAFDVVRIDQLHAWPFWGDTVDTRAYTVANLDVIHSERNDNPMISNIFAIYAKSALRLSQNAQGGTSLVHLSNASIDHATYGIWVDNTVTTGSTALLENVTYLGSPTAADNKFLYVQGNNSRLDFGKVKTNLMKSHAVNIGGTGNAVVFANLTVISWDQAAAGNEAIEVAASNFVYFTERPTFVANGTTVGSAYSTTGIISVDEWRNYTPTVGSASGTIGTHTVNGQYRRVNDMIDVRFEVAITTNSTAAGTLTVTLPFGPAVSNDVGAGRIYVGSGHAMTVTVAAAGSTAVCVKYDNTYPGADGASLIGHVSYRV